MNVFGLHIIGVNFFQCVLIAANDNGRFVDVEKENRFRETQVA